jgi:hypothetical protein
MAQSIWPLPKKKFENALGEEGFFPAAVLSRQLSPTVSRAID